MVKKAIFFFIAGIAVGKYLLIDGIFDKIFPDKKTAWIFALVMIGLGIYYSRKEGGFKVTW